MPLAQETAVKEATTSVEMDTFVEEGANITIAASLIPSQSDQSLAKQNTNAKTKTKSALITKYRRPTPHPLLLPLQPQPNTINSNPLLLLLYLGRGSKSFRSQRKKHRRSYR